MIRPLELHIGLRYTRARRRNHFISFISLTSMLGIAVGVWALITVLSVMNGFERELRLRILAVTSHLTVSGPGGALRDWEQLAGRLDGLPGVTGRAPYILGQGLLANGSAVSGALIRGVLPEQEATVSDITGSMRGGRFDALTPGSWGVVLGAALARSLRVEVGDKVTLISPQGQVTPAGLLPRLKRFTVAGIFEVGMYEYDSGLAYIHLQDAALLYRTGDSVSGLRLRLDDVFRAPWLRHDLQRDLGDGYLVNDWTREHSTFFNALRIERRVMFIILSLIVAVAAFNIVSTLVMVVTDKQADIAILRTLGLSPASVMGVFVVLGTVIGVIGTLLGALAGVLTALNIETLVPMVENMLGIKFFPPDVYVISDFPAELHWRDVTHITVAALVMSALATLYPAWRASRVQPAEALRYE